MMKLLIDDVRDNVHVNFNNDTGILSLKGHSIPINSKEFFEPLNVWLKNYLASKPTQIIMNISMEYLHTRAYKQLYSLLKLLSEWKHEGNNLVVNWYYAEADLDMKQLGADLSGLLVIPFHFLKADENDSE